MAKLKQISNCGFTAGEFTKSGIDCINLIAAFEEIKVQAGFCDLKSLNLRKFSIPKNSVFYTCWTMACLKGFSEVSLKEIIKKRPSEVVHIEPIFEHWNDANTLHLFWKRYLNSTIIIEHYVKD